MLGSRDRLGARFLYHRFHASGYLTLHPAYPYSSDASCPAVAADDLQGGCAWNRPESLTRLHPLRDRNRSARGVSALDGVVLSAAFFGHHRSGHLSLESPGTSTRPDRRARTPGSLPVLPRLHPPNPAAFRSTSLDAGLRTFAYTDFDNGTAPNPSVSPDYSNPLLLQCLVDFIQAFGTRYDGDPRIAFLTAGLYGFWGEWHVNDHPHPGEREGFAMTQADKDRLLQTYKASFHLTPIEVRYANVTPNPELLANFGLHDDSFLQDTLGPLAWHFWPTVRGAGATTNWQTHPTGGEVRPEVQPHLFDDWPNNEGEDLQTAISTHSSHLDAGRSALQYSVDLHPDAQRAPCRTPAWIYLFLLLRTHSPRIRMAPPRSRCGWRIGAVAPIAYAWPVELEALDATNQPLSHVQAAWPLPALLPGQTAEWSVLLQIPPNAAVLVLRIANPLKGGDPVAFANAEMGTVVPGWLTLPAPAATAHHP